MGKKGAAGRGHGQGKGPEAGAHLGVPGRTKASEAEQSEVKVKKTTAGGSGTRRAKFVRSKCAHGW